MKRMTVLGIALATAFTVACDRGDRGGMKISRNDSGAVGTSGENGVSRADADFVHDIAVANMAEIDLGQLASSRAASPDVKKFAQMMIDDHTKAGDSLKNVVSQHAMTLPSAVDDKHRDLHDKLSKYQGAEFDREYMKAMVDGHEDVLDKLGSRIDQPRLTEWKIERNDRMAGHKIEVRGEEKVILPEKSKNPVTFSLNQWAATTYPKVFEHLEAAKTLHESVDNNRGSN